jgi:superfamily II DNA/RNA helicase
VHVDPPAEHKAYLHRSGRTARAGSGGDVVTLVLPEQMGDVRALTRAAKITATPTAVRSGAPHLVRLVGEVAPFVTPTALTAAEQAPGRSQGGGRNGGGRNGGGRNERSGAREGGRRSGRGRAAEPHYSTSSAPRTASPQAATHAGSHGASRPTSAAGASTRRSGAVELSMRGNGRRRGR